MKYWYTKEVEYSFEEAIKKITNSMAEEKFWVLTQFNLQEIFKNKLEKNIEKYIVLGFCNPSLAYEAVSEEIEMGLILPCNIIVFEKNKKVFVSAIMPNSWIEFSTNSKIIELTKIVENKLKNAIDNI